VKLHAHSVQYAYELVSTRCALENTSATNHHQDQEWGTASHPPDPHWLLCFLCWWLVPRWLLFLCWWRGCFTACVVLLFWGGRTMLRWHDHRREGGISRSLWILPPNELRGIKNEIPFPFSHFCKWRAVACIWCWSVLNHRSPFRCGLSMWSGKPLHVWVLHFLLVRWQFLWNAFDKEKNQLWVQV